MGTRWRLAAGLALCVAAGCRFDPTALAPADGSGPAGDAASPDVAAAADAARPDAARPDASRPDAARPDATLADAPADAEAGDAADATAAGDDAATSDAPPPDAATTCSGVVVGGYCWYASPQNQSCNNACSGHGGCNLAGTRDYAGSGGSDGNCIAVLTALGYGSYRHQSWSNNNLGCQFAWPNDPWTYWSTMYATTCEASDPGQAHVVRMCACNQ